MALVDVAAVMATHDKNSPVNSGRQSAEDVLAVVDGVGVADGVGATDDVGVVVAVEELASLAGALSPDRFFFLPVLKSVSYQPPPFKRKPGAESNFFSPA